MTNPKSHEPKEKDWGALTPEPEEETEIDIGAEQPALSHLSREELETQLNAAEAQANKYEAQVNEAKEQVLRYQADADNLRRRTARELEQAHKYTLERFAKELLPVADNLERSLEQMEGKELGDLTVLYTGVELTLQQLQKVLEKFAIKPINPLGEMFDPALHEAMSVQEHADKAPGTILAVLQKGYLLNDRLVRPALVVVAKAAEKNSTGA